MTIHNAVWRAAVALTLMAGTPVAAWAHHSHAMFDDTKNVTIKGAVKSFVYANPHVYLFVNVQNSDGSLTDYAVEMSYVQAMMKQGIGPDTFKEGDTISVVINPLRSGVAGGSYVSAIDVHGQQHGRHGD